MLREIYNVSSPKEPAFVLLVVLGFFAIGYIAYRVGAYFYPESLRRFKVVMSLILAGVVLLAIVGMGGAWAQAAPCRKALASGSGAKVSGRIEHCTPFRDGVGCARLRVSGQTFAAGDAGQVCGGNTSALYDQRLSEGTFVEVTYWRADVLRVAVAVP